MFGLSFGEIILIMLVALLVIGPKRLPDLGNQLGRLMRSWKMMKFEYQEQFREATHLKTHLEELKKVADPKQIIQETISEPK